MTGARWRKRPVTVDAVRNDGTWGTILAWLDQIGYEAPFLLAPAVTRNPDGTLNISTARGTERAEVGDWVVRSQGVFYTVKPDVFEAAYEPELPAFIPAEQWTDKQAEKFQAEWEEFLSSPAAPKIRVLPPGGLQGPATHIAGAQVQVGSWLRQRCGWCGEILCDYDLDRVAVPPGQDPEPPVWEPGRLVQVNCGVSVLIDHVDGAMLPEDSCARTGPAAITS